MGDIPYYRGNGWYTLLQRKHSWFACEMILCSASCSAKPADMPASCMLVPDSDWEAYLYGLAPLVRDDMQHLCSHCINSLWPGVTIWWLKSGLPLAQVMACCLTALSHYLNQCSPVINKVQLHSPEDDFARYTSAINQQKQFRNYLFRI